MTRHMGMEGLYTRTETASMEIGCKTKLTVEVLMSILMEPSIPVTGKKTNNTVTVLKLGPTMQGMKAITSTEENMESALSSGKMDQPILASSTTIISMGRAFTLGSTVASTKASGEPTRCTVKELSSGQTVVSTLGSM